MRSRIKKEIPDVLFLGVDFHMPFYQQICRKENIHVNVEEYNSMLYAIIPVIVAIEVKERGILLYVQICTIGKVRGILLSVLNLYCAVECMNVHRGLFLLVFK